MSDYKLLPCPFCGGEAELKSQEVEYGLCGAWVLCKECNAKSNYMNTHELHLRQGSISTPMTEESRRRGIERAIASWNTRAQLSRQKGE